MDLLFHGFLCFNTKREAVRYVFDVSEMAARRNSRKRDIEAASKVGSPWKAGNVVIRDSNVKRGKLEGKTGNKSRRQ